MGKILIRVLLTLFVGMTFITFVHAQPETQPENLPESPSENLPEIQSESLSEFQSETLSESQPEKLPEIIVVGEPLLKGLENKLKEQPATIHSIYGEEIEKMDIRRTLDIIRRIPGVTAEDYNQAGVAAAYSFRGFRAGHGIGAGCYLDGIPYNEINHVDGDGYPDYNTILPESIERLEVIKGSFSPLYGGYAQAGILHYITKEKGDYTKLKISTGSWNYQRGVTEIAREYDRLYTYNGISFERGDGYRDHSESQTGNIFSRFGYKLGEKSNIRLTLHSYKIEWDAPGPITEEAWNADDLRKVMTDGGGNKEKYMASLDYSYKIGIASEINILGYAYHSDFTRWTGSNNQERNDIRDTFGSRAGYYLSNNFAGMENLFIIGIDYEYSDSEAHKWSVLHPETRERDEELLSGDFNFQNISFYFQDDFKPFSFMKLTLGCRYELFEGDLENKLTSKEDSYSEQMFNPKGGILITPIEGVEIYSNIGTAFVLPKGFLKYENSELDPSRLVSYELGTRFLPVSNTMLQFAAFRTDTTDEVITDPVTLTETNAGKTKREGLEASVEYYLTANTLLYLNGVYQRPKYVDYETSSGDLSGNDIQRVPEYIAKAGIEYFPEKGFGASLTGTYTGERWSDSANTVREDDFFVTNASLRYAWEKSKLTCFVNNLFDEKYAELRGTNSFYPNDPLNVTLSYSMEF